ncbi:hypothetical protein [Brevibacterium sediminis]|uniref:hypothetical protein n=1 Tax=Brevibacterium sediminis TaxID=1857024 RepID=UPI00366FE17F
MIERTIPKEGHHHFESVAAFHGPLPGASTTYTIMLDDVPIDLRFDDRGFDTTVVFFHAAITKAVRRYPVFSGSTFSEDIAANRLFISDPSLYVDSRIKLGWYAGSSRQPKLQDALTEIISRFDDPDHRLVFFGASGGGFASLYYATHFPGSIAVPVNPQTTIRNYVPVIVNRYLTCAWDGLPVDELPVCTDVIELYRRPVANSVIYVQNSGDSGHMDQHYSPFMNALPVDHSVEPYIIDAGEGHVPPKRQVLARILGDAVRA